MNVREWCFRKFLKNFGVVEKNSIYRSGQPGWIRRAIIYYFYPFKSVINLAWAPNTDCQDNDEKIFCTKRGIKYCSFLWGAGGPISKEEMLKAYELMIKLDKPIWVHCEGGKDRTGGLIAFWKKQQGYSFDNMFEDFEVHKYPAWRWIGLL